MMGKEALGQNIKLKIACVQAGDRQYRIAHRAGITPNKLSGAIHRGERLRPAEARSLARVLKKDPEELFPPEGR